MEGTVTKCKWCGPLRYNHKDGQFYTTIWSDYTNDWCSFPFYFFDAPAVYVIYDGGKVVYIGSTAGLRYRLKAHRAGILKKLQNPRIKFSFTKHYGDWLMREARLIKRLKPVCNNSSAHKKRIMYG